MNCAGCATQHFGGVVLLFPAHCVPLIYSRSLSFTLSPHSKRSLSSFTTNHTIFFICILNCGGAVLCLFIYIFRYMFYLWFFANFRSAFFPRFDGFLFCLDLIFDKLFFFCSSRVFIEENCVKSNSMCGARMFVWCARIYGVFGYVVTTTVIGLIFRAAKQKTKPRSENNISQCSVARCAHRTNLNPAEQLNDEFGKCSLFLNELI